MCQTKDRQDPLSKGNPINTFHPPGGAQEYLTAVSGNECKICQLFNFTICVTLFLEHEVM